MCTGSGQTRQVVCQRSLGTELKITAKREWDRSSYGTHVDPCHMTHNLRCTNASQDPYRRLDMAPLLRLVVSLLVATRQVAIASECLVGCSLGGSDPYEYNWDDKGICSYGSSDCSVGGSTGCGSLGFTHVSGHTARSPADVCAPFAEAFMILILLVHTCKGKLSGHVSSASFKQLNSRDITWAYVSTPCWTMELWHA